MHGTRNLTNRCAPVTWGSIFAACGGRGWPVAETAIVRSWLDSSHRFGYGRAVYKLKSGAYEFTSNRYAADASQSDEKVDRRRLKAHQHPRVPDAAG
jgi:hypothetical protein